MENDDTTTEDLLNVLTPEEESKKLFQPKKRGVDFVDRFGKKEKKRRIIEFCGISDMCLPPITRNTIATYRLIGYDEIDRSSRQPREPQDVSIPGSYIFHDRGETDLARKNKLVMLKARPDVRRDKISGKEIMDDDIVQEVFFLRSHARANPMAEYPKYAFLELHPLNKSNPFRPTDISPIFERIDLYRDASRSLAFKLAAQDLALEAEIEVKNMDTKRAVGFATSAGIPTTENGIPRPIGVIKQELRVFARNNPKAFYGMASNAKPAVKLMVLDAIHFGLIELDRDKKSFFVSATDEKIFTHATDEDPTEALVSYLMSDKGQLHYEAMDAMVNFWK